MADPTLCPPLTRSSVQAAHELIKPYIKKTPVLTCSTLSQLASTPQPPSALIGTPFEGQTPCHPKINLFFKCENFQSIGAFKIRGATHALARLGDEELKNGVVTHSSGTYPSPSLPLIPPHTTPPPGNHAQALALAAHRRHIPAHIVMPSISTPTKIAATRSYGAHVIFSGSTSAEREAVVADVIRATHARLIPPYDHPDIILGQGTLALEMEDQVSSSSSTLTPTGRGRGLDAVIAPLGGGGMLSGIATALHGTSTRVYGAEPTFEGADDGRRGLAAAGGERVTSVRSLTIADGLRTPVGEIPWRVISRGETRVEGVFGVGEGQIRAAVRLVVERMKVVVEPSAVVGLAVVLWDEGFRRGVVGAGGGWKGEEEEGGEGWNVGVVLSGGNVSVEALGGMFGDGGGGGDGEREREREREEGLVGADGARVAENVAG
ncbi:hypothetical protein MMC20_002443 [Loxospora ochrophaea]|nr:hypothetical protein [Loxospora ochrophaea]